MCERGVWLWLRGGEGRWHVGWGISGRRLAEVGERVRVGGVCGCGCGVAWGDGAQGGGSAVVGSPKSERGCEWGVRVWLRGGEERGRAGRGISGRRLVEVGERDGRKGSRRRGSVV